MTAIRITLALLAAAVTLLLTACGGGQNVPSGAIAVVNGTAISRSDLDGWLAQAKKSYEAQQQDFPKVGTPEYQNIQTQYVAYLVQRAEFEQTAKDLGVKITKKDVDKGVRDYIKAKFNGNRKDFEKALQRQAFPEETFRQTISFSVLGQKIFDKVTADVAVPEPDVLTYYNQNISSYRSPESRVVRHILIAETVPGYKASPSQPSPTAGQIDYAKSKAEADRIYAQLKAGGDFVSLAKQYSADTQSKDAGGKLTISRGQTVPEFEKTAFALKKGEISKPVKTTYGYHVIQALSNVKPAKTTPLAQVEDAIRAQLLQQKKQEFMTNWVESLNKKYKSKISYATGFAPPEIPSTSTETQTQ